jgi:hypothetical protein
MIECRESGYGSDFTNEGVGISAERNRKERHYEIHFDDEHDASRPRRAGVAKDRPGGAHRLYDEPE